MVFVKKPEIEPDRVLKYGQVALALANKDNNKKGTKVTLEQGAYLAEIIGVVVIVVTLIFLTIQVRQGTELLRSESRQALVTNDITSLAANFQNADVFAKYVSESQLSAEDQLRMSFMFALDLRNREFEYFQYTRGLLDEQTWLAYRHVLAINHSTGLGRVWWDKIGRQIVDPAFAKLVDDVLVDAKPDDTYKQMASWANEQKPEPPEATPEDSNITS